MSYIKFNNRLTTLMSLFNIWILNILIILYYELNIALILFILIIWCNNWVAYICTLIYELWMDVMNILMMVLISIINRVEYCLMIWMMINRMGWFRVWLLNMCDNYVRIDWWLWIYLISMI